MPAICRHCCKHEGHSSEQDTISPLGELPDWNREANYEEDKSHKLVRWAESYRELLGGSGQMSWYGLALILNGHPIFRMLTRAGQRQGRQTSRGLLQSHCVT